MNKNLPIWVFIMTLIMCGCQQDKKPMTTDMTTDKELVAENDSIAILYQELDSINTETIDPPRAAIWIKNKTTKQETKLYQTIRREWHSWYIADGNRFYPVPIDSIFAASNTRVRIWKSNPLQLIVQGNDERNEFCYFIDVPKRKAWYVPANQGFVGATSEEGYMIFLSYRYNSDPDMGGRHTFLQIFDKAGNMVDSVDLEHIYYNVSMAEKYIDILCAV